jgi:16S rRNA (guanine527-N7)-methyltransferase
LENFVQDGLKLLKLDIHQEQIDKLQIYLEALKKWNKVFNLTAISSDKDIVIKHFFDSLSVNEYIKDATRILDVGTGAGFPGLVLAIFNSDKKFFLVDGVSKKITFIDEMKGRLKLNNVTTYHSRVEDLKMEECVDLVISRAFADIQKMMTLTKHLLKEKGKYLAMKGPDYLYEINNIKGNNKIYDLKVPYFNGIRKLIEITKHD